VAWGSHSWGGREWGYGIAQFAAGRKRIKYRLFLRVDGLEPSIYQFRNDDTIPGNPERVIALRAPADEWTHAIDLGELVDAPSALTFELDDIDED
jgi:hypothetical protein